MKVESEVGDHGTLKTGKDHIIRIETTALVGNGIDRENGQLGIGELGSYLSTTNSLTFAIAASAAGILRKIIQESADLRVLKQDTEQAGNLAGKIRLTVQAEVASRRMSGRVIDASEMTHNASAKGHLTGDPRPRAKRILQTPLSTLPRPARLLLRGPRWTSTLRPPTIQH